MQNKERRIKRRKKLEKYAFKDHEDFSQVIMEPRQR